MTDPRPPGPPRPAGPAEGSDRSRRLEALLDELIYLRKGAGFTPARLAKTTHVLHLLGGESEPFANLRERMCSAIGSLHERDAQVLLDVCGLSPEVAGIALLQDRRAVVAEKMGVQPATIADWEGPALEHLRTQLTTGWYPLSPVALRVPMAHNGLIQEFVSVQAKFVNRSWLETREHYRFVVAFDELDYIAISRSTPGPAVPGEGFTVESTQVRDSYSHRFFSPVPMRRGQAHDLRFTMLPDPDRDPESADELVVEESRAFHEPTRFASFTVDFDLELPRTIWAFTGSTYFERPGEPEPNQRLTADKNGTVKATFRELYGGLFSGIAWEW
jgi:hypothetical protein